MDVNGRFYGGILQIHIFNGWIFITECIHVPSTLEFIYYPDWLDIFYFSTAAAEEIDPSKPHLKL